MSRKRGKKQVEAIPEEVLAEGSGPVEGAVVHVGIDVIAGESVDELAAAAAAVGIEAIERHAEPIEAPADADFAADAQAADAVAAADADEVVAADADVDADADAGAADAVAESSLEPIDPVEMAAPEALEEISDEEASELGAQLPTSANTMDAAQLKHLVEALVFASDKPITVVRLRQLTRVGDVRRLEQALADIAEDYRDRGIVLQQVSGGYQFRTRTQFSNWVQQLIVGRPVRLSRAQLETLAIIAYRQPITRPEIDEIRGVDSTATLKLLLDRSLIRILGKKEEAGRPMLYGTTKDFLDFFSLGDLRELPTLREYSELTDESRQVMSDRLGIDPDVPEEVPADEVVEEVPQPSTIEELIASYTASMPDNVVDDSSTTAVFEVTPDSATTGVFDAAPPAVAGSDDLSALAARRVAAHDTDGDADDDESSSSSEPPSE